MNQIDRQIMKFIFRLYEKISSSNISTQTIFYPLSDAELFPIAPFTSVPSFPHNNSIIDKISIIIVNSSQAINSVLEIAF